MAHPILHPEAWTAKVFVIVVVGAIIAYATLRCIYLLYFHPLAKFPGPPIAAVSNWWYARKWLSGRYPWAIEDAIHKYGDVVRIAPNELVFFTPRAFTDIYKTAYGCYDFFQKTDFHNFDANLGGLAWEEDPVKHLQARRMRQIGAEGVSLRDWTYWVAWDISQDGVWTGARDASAMRQEKHPVALDVLLRFNALATLIMVSKRFPLLNPVKFLFAPAKKLSSLADLKRNVLEGLSRRIHKPSSQQYPDMFDFTMLFYNWLLPEKHRERLNLGSVPFQAMLAGFGPMADWWYFLLFYLLETPECYQALTDEIRAEFRAYHQITLPAATGKLPYLNACLLEVLRLMSFNSTGLPRYSPGAMVDGHFIPKGITVQSSIHTLGRHPRFFHRPMQFHPERYLPVSHPRYEEVFNKDWKEPLPAFGWGPRACMGWSLAWEEAKMFVSKLLWEFDVLKAPEETLDMEWMERELLHFSFLVKPKMMVRFVPVERMELANGV